MKILQKEAEAIAERKNALGIKTDDGYLTALVRHDLRVQDMRKRYSVLPLTAHRLSWSQLWEMFRKKLWIDWDRWRYGEYDDE